ncbi:hypothetical protein GGI02_001412 [Coemansia sp. RSA 2322]|nr:hypothetical protein GGI02_001412 [Coemansia sp. RSA 2322]
MNFAAEPQRRSSQHMPSVAAEKVQARLESMDAIKMPPPQEPSKRKPVARRARQFVEEPLYLLPSHYALLQDSTYELIRGLANLSSAVEVDPLYFDQLLGAAVNVKHAFDLGRMDVINGTIRPRNTSLCHECITTVSSVWRSGPEGPRTLCNACGLRYYKQNQRRTVEAKRRESKDVADAAASLAALGSVSMKAVESLIAKNDFATSCNKRKRSIVSGSNEYSDDDDENDDDDDEVYDDDDENDDEEDDGYIGTQRKVASDKGGGSRHEDKSFRGETGLAGAASPQHSPGVVTLPSIANICDRCHSTMRRGITTSL